MFKRFFKKCIHVSFLFPFNLICSEPIQEIAEPVVNAKAGPLKSFIAGGVGGSCLVLVGQPFDTVKGIKKREELKVFVVVF